MPNIPIMAKIICPFFLRFGGNKVGNGRLICEGLIPGSETCSCFSSGKDCDAWVQGVCASYEYGTLCQVASTILNRYTGATK